MVDSPAPMLRYGGHFEIYDPVRISSNLFQKLELSTCTHLTMNVLIWGSLWKEDYFAIKNF
jgi:hypothetical protein